MYSLGDKNDYKLIMQYSQLLSCIRICLCSLIFSLEKRTDGAWCVELCTCTAKKIIVASSNRRLWLVSSILRCLLDHGKIGPQRIFYNPPKFEMCLRYKFYFSNIGCNADNWKIYHTIVPIPIVLNITGKSLINRTNNSGPKIDP